MREALTPQPGFAMVGLLAVWFGFGRCPADLRPPAPVGRSRASARGASARLLARSSQFPCRRPSAPCGAAGRERAEALHHELADDRRARELLARARCRRRVILEHRLGARARARGARARRRSARSSPRPRAARRARRGSRAARARSCAWAATTSAGWRSRLLGQAEADQVRARSRARRPSASARPSAHSSDQLAFPCRHSTTGPRPSSTKCMRPCGVSRKRWRNG